MGEKYVHATKVRSRRQPWLTPAPHTACPESLIESGRGSGRPPRRPVRPIPSESDFWARWRRLREPVVGAGGGGGRAGRSARVRVRTDGVACSSPRSGHIPSRPGADRRGPSPRGGVEQMQGRFARGRAGARWEEYRFSLRFQGSARMVRTGCRAPICAEGACAHGSTTAHRNRARKPQNHTENRPPHRQDPPLPRATPS